MEVIRSVIYLIIMLLLFRIVVFLFKKHKSLTKFIDYKKDMFGDLLFAALFYCNTIIIMFVRVFYLSFAN